MKNFITILIITSFVSQITGCYSFQSVSVAEFEKFIDERGKPGEIYVKTKENEWFHFTSFNYHIKNDTLFGNGKLLKDGRGEISSTKIAISHIESIGIEKKDQVKTYLVYAGIGLMVIGIIIFSKVIFSEDHTL